MLTPEYHGYTDGYILINDSAAIKWRDGRMTTLIRVANLLNRRIQQHIFGDLPGRSVVAELRASISHERTGGNGHEDTPHGAVLNGLTHRNESEKNPVERQNATQRFTSAFQATDSAV